MHPVLDDALALWRAGLSVIPVKRDGSKAPAVVWREYQTGRAGEATIRQWFASGEFGIGVVCGAVSGNLLVFDFEDLASFDRWAALVPADILAALPVAETPGGRAARLRPPVVPAAGRSKTGLCAGGRQELPAGVGNTGRGELRDRPRLAGRLPRVGATVPMGPPRLARFGAARRDGRRPRERGGEFVRVGVSNHVIGLAATPTGGTAPKPVQVIAGEPCPVAGKEVTAGKDRHRTQGPPGAAVR
jgi:hypothetical protein